MQVKLLEDGSKWVHLQIELEKLHSNWRLVVYQLATGTRSVWMVPLKKLLINYTWTLTFLINCVFFTAMILQKYDLLA
jgi:hypothetical protein